MSASLVGSEMCIRDRRKALATAMSSRRASRVAPLASTPPELGRGSVGAVSYTHLTLPTICSV
eukprot:10345245-Alexandrium_andersonii.AAC.1